MMQPAPQNYRFVQSAVTIPDGKSMQILPESLNRQALYLHCATGDDFYLALEQGPLTPTDAIPGILARSVVLKDLASEPRQFIFTPVNAVTVTNSGVGADITITILEGFFPAGCGCRDEYQNYRFTTNALTLPAGYSQQALPENPKRRALYIWSPFGHPYLAALEMGPLTPQPLVTGIVNRSIIGSHFGTVPCPWFNTPVNAITLTNNGIAPLSCVVLEGFDP